MIGNCCCAYPSPPQVGKRARKTQGELKVCALRNKNCRLVSELTSRILQKRLFIRSVLTCLHLTLQSSFLLVSHVWISSFLKKKGWYFCNLFKFFLFFYIFSSTGFSGVQILISCRVKLEPTLGVEKSRWICRYISFQWNWMPFFGGKTSLVLL
jgi:hypothetical protein